MNKINFSDIVDDRMTGASPFECAHKVERRILRIFDMIFSENNLKYCLAYRTLLGDVQAISFP